ncbi:MAG TPA: DUF5667 domain-containing protein [Candidatus Methanoperedens sp.]
MNIRGILKVGMIMLIMGFALNIIGIARALDTTEDLVDDIGEYNGSVGPDNALYGLKLAFENIDESFTWNGTEKLGKKVSHSRIRIAEAKTELKMNNSEAAEKAFEHYKEKVNETEDSISGISGNDSGILNAQMMNEKHQYVLEQLLETHPNNAGLQNAYNRSLELKDKFEQKTERKIERIRTNEGKNIFREIKKEREVLKKDDSKDSQDSKITAKISGNDSNINIELKFETNSTENATIAGDILSELRLTRDNISSLLRIENGTEESSNESLEADSQIGMNISKVNVQYKFNLNETNRTEIIDGIYGKLSALTQDKIQVVLVTKVNQEEEDSGKENIRNDRGMRKEDITPVKYENKTEVKDNITPMKHENKTEVKGDRRINRQED